MKHKKNKAPALSVCMIVRNEEACLENCLKSVADHVDEIIIVDTGSTDHTVEIAKSFNARIYHHPWQDNFSLHRNQSISYAKGRWIFIIDADEEYRASSHRSLREEVAGADKRGIEALALRVENRCNEGKETVCLDSIRIFRANGRIRYEGIVHNHLLGFKNHTASLGRIIHYGYDQGPEVAREKFERTVALLKKQIMENSNNALPHLYLSNSYALMNRYEEALQESLTTIKLVEAQNIIHKQYVKAFYNAARSYIQLRRYDEAEGICHHALSRYGDCIDIFAAQTMIRFFKKEWAGIIESGSRYREALERYQRNESGLEMVEIATYSEEWKICYWMGAARLNLGDIEGAEALFLRALDLAPDKAFICRQAGTSLFEAGHHNRAQIYMEQAQLLSAPSHRQPARDVPISCDQSPGVEAGTAQRVSSKGLRISLDHSEIFFSKGMNLEKAGKIDEAEKIYRETIRLNNSHVGAYNNLAGILLRRNEEHVALNILQSASSTALNHPALRYTLGLVYSVLGKDDEALEQFDKALEFVPGLKKVNIQKAVIYLKINRFDDAIKCLHKEIENSGDILPALITLGEISLHRADLSKALDYFQRALSVAPDNIYVKKHIESISH